MLPSGLDLHVALSGTLQRHLLVEKIKIIPTSNCTDCADLHGAMAPAMHILDHQQCVIRSKHTYGAFERQQCLLTMRLGIHSR
jgi:hypothetical protein